MMKMTASQIRQSIIDWKCHANNPSKKGSTKICVQENYQQKSIENENGKATKEGEKKNAKNTFRWSLVKYVRLTFPRCC